MKRRLSSIFRTLRFYVLPMQTKWLPTPWGRVKNNNKKLKTWSFRSVSCNAEQNFIKTWKWALGKNYAHVTYINQRRFMKLQFWSVVFFLKAIPMCCLVARIREKSESGNRIMIMIRFFIIATTEPYSSAENLQLFETLPSNSSSTTPAFFALLSQCIHALMTFRWVFTQCIYTSFLLILKCT